MLDFLQRIASLIKFAGYVSSKNVRTITITIDGVQHSALMMVPYGMQISLPASSSNILALSLEEKGAAENLVAIAADNINVDTPKVNNLNPGEVSVGIPAKNTRLHFLADGTIEIIYNGTIPSQGVADYLTKYNELASAMSSLQTAFNTHVHTGVTTGPGSSAVPAAPITIDISASKFNPLKVPNA